MAKPQRFIPLLALLSTTLFSQTDLASRHGELHPGESAEMILRTMGPEANFFTTMYCVVRLVGNADPSQAEYAKAMGTHPVSRDEDGTFHLRFAVTDYTATGEYKLSACHIQSADSSVGFDYGAPELESTETFHVDNKRRYEKPKIVIVKP